MKKIIAFLLLICSLAVNQCMHNKGPVLIGGIALSFDDYFVDNWYESEPLFREFGVQVTFYVCCWHDMTPEQKQKLLLLQKAGHEIAYHGCNHLNVQTALTQLSLQQYLSKEIFPDLDSMRKSGLTVTNFAYPFGCYTAQTDSALMQVFHCLRKTTLCSWDHYTDRFSDAVFEKPGKSHYLFSSSIDNIGKLNLKGLTDAMDFARKEHKVLILSGHYISNKPGDYYTTPETLRYILQEAKKRNLKFYRTKDLVNSGSSAIAFKNK